jgi:peroxiredoxin
MRAEVTMLSRVLSIGVLVLAVGCSDELSSERAEAQAKQSAPPAEIKHVETKAPARPSAAEATAGVPAEIGKPAPDFSLVDTEGKTVKLSALRGKTVVLEWWNPDCPFVKHAHESGPLKDFAKRVSNDTLVWLTINSNAPGKQGHGTARNQSAKTEYGVDNVVLLDETGQVGRSYGALKTPHMYVIDAKGTLVYRGGLDNAPIGKVDEERPRLPQSKSGSLEPYVEYALSDVAAKRSVRLADTPAYGCTVKYAD